MTDKSRELSKPSPEQIGEWIEKVMLGEIEISGTGELIRNEALALRDKIEGVDRQIAQLKKLEALLPQLHGEMKAYMKILGQIRKESFQ